MAMELARLALSNLLRARARLVMTAGGVVVGTAAVMLLIALTDGLQRSAEAGIGSSTTLTRIDVYTSFVFNATPEETNDLPVLNNRAVATFQRLRGVRAVVPSLNVLNTSLALGDEIQGYAQIIGTDPAYFAAIGLETDTGDLTLGRNEALFGSQLRYSFYNNETFEPIEVDVLQRQPTLIQTDNSGNSREVTLNFKAQLIEKGDYMIDGMVYVRLEDALALNAWALGDQFDPNDFKYDSITVYTTGRDQTRAVADAIRELGYQAGGTFEYLEQLEGFFGTMRLMLGGIGGVALLVAAFGVANTMTMAILERTREIGLMKAIGASNQDVLTIFLIEAGLVGFVGGAGGVAIALLLQNAINGAVRNYASSGDAGSVGSFLPINLSSLTGDLVAIDPALMLFAIGLATSVGLLAGVYPAYRAAVRLTPVLALKSD